MGHVLPQGAGQSFIPNLEQSAVIEAPCHEWLLVVAGPGTGKTQVAAMRLLHLMRQGLQPAQILVLSFSRSAVATLGRRLASLRLDDEGLVEDLRHLAIRTFDSWAFRMLRQSGAPVAELLSQSHDQNISLVTDALNQGSSAMVDRLAGIGHVIVDEFQDLPGVRAEMVASLLSRLSSDGRKRVGFTVLGDPVQGIYRFAARNSGGPMPADPWRDLKNRMGSELREIALTRNHRSTEQLAHMAASLRKILSSSALDAGKKLAAMKRFLDRLPVSASDAKLDSAWLSQLPEGSLAILTRTNGETLRVWKMLLGDSFERPSVSVRMRLAGAVTSAPAWISALLSRFKHPTITRKVFEFAYAKVDGELDPDIRSDLNLPPIEVAWRRLARASGASDTVTSIDLGELRERLEWPDSFPDDQVREDAAVYITTVHQAKGMEFDNVAILDARAREDDDSPDDPLEEANVGFVAVTRAGRQLGRLPSSAIYKAPTQRRFEYGRIRQVNWGGMVNFQAGLPGDIEASSFVDLATHGDVAAVESVQHALLHHVSDWRGHKVVLRQVSAVADSRRARDVRYEIRLQTAEGDQLLLGRTAAQLTHDLLDLLWKPGYVLPRVIYNLRIAEVISTCTNTELPETVPDPWRSSRMWLGVSLVGTGDFKTWKRHDN
ncbi:UvrD-helicase domain-containing protein [Cupriavidus plantarum]|uniref:UvrD-helicase domain-containing protein n=1 Tax=Cupriavidus plantarum TaxID=942865 RepID=UPI000EB58E48|nr:UvrD-helicase domain-containing protein [Cupriavidus plantarum]RLK29627.1 UvrD-like helicase family protein [Cupriavidus plantarum]